MYIADNAVIMAAGTASRFEPLSRERPKGLLEVRGEVLIERQIRQLREAGIDDIYVVVGYKKEMFSYLTRRYGARLLENPEYLTRNNHASVRAAREVLGNTFLCSADNYFTVNPFQREVDEAYYAAVYAGGDTKEWCMTEGPDGFIDSVTVGGRNAWYMLGHTFWTRSFSRAFLEILDRVYNDPDTPGKYWEDIFREHLDTLKMKIRRYPAEVIAEFDTLDELRAFDESYIDDTRSAVLKDLARRLSCREGEITGISPLRQVGGEAAGFRFFARGALYEYRFADNSLTTVNQ